MLFILPKKIFLFSRYSNFCIPVFPSFSPLGHCFKGRLKIKLYSIWSHHLPKEELNNTCFCYLKKEKRYEIETMSKEHFYGKIM